MKGVMKSKSAQLSSVRPIAITIIVVTSLPIATVGEKNQDAVEDIISKQSQFVAALPNGARIQLIGLREYEYPSEGKKWWRPEGCIIETQKWPRVKTGVQALVIGNGRTDDPKKQITYVIERFWQAIEADDVGQVDRLLTGHAFGLGGHNLRRWIAHMRDERTRFKQQQNFDIRDMKQILIEKKRAVAVTGANADGQLMVYYLIHPYLAWRIQYIDTLPLGTHLKNLFLRWPDQKVSHSAFLEYMKVGDFLYKAGARVDAAKRYLAVADRYPYTWRGIMCQNLGQMLASMAAEDMQFREPEDVSALSIQEQIDYYIYKLRDLAERELFIPGSCNVIRDSRMSDSAAVALRKIGKPAVTKLIELLEDRQPTRSVGASLNGGYVLRYCDAALQILEVITGERFGKLNVRDGLGGRERYLSNIKADYRNRIISRIKTWWAENQHKSESEWIREALSETGIGAMWDRLEIAKRLIELDGKKSVNFFRERLNKEPDNPRTVSLLWSAGSKAVVKDIRSKVCHRDFNVRAAAYRALVEAGEPEIVDTVIQELQHTLERADQKRHYPVGTLTYILIRSDEEKAVLTAARLIRHENPTIVESVLVSFQTVLKRENKPSPHLRRVVFPYMATVLDDKNLRHWAAWWLINAANLPIEYASSGNTQTERDKMIQQLKAWWQQHKNEYPRFDK